MILVTLFLLAPVTQAQFQRDGPMERMKPVRKGDYALQISPQKDRVALLEPIPIRFRLSSKMKDPQLLRHFGITLSSIKLMIRTPNGETLQPLEFTHRVGSQMAQSKGPNLAEWTDAYDYRLDWYTGQVGKYKIKAAIQLQDVWVSSDWMTIRVVPPEESYFSVYDFLREQFQQNLFGYGDIGAKKSFLMCFVNTPNPYADYVTYALATDYHYSNNNPMAKRLFTYLNTLPQFAHAGLVRHRLKHIEAPDPTPTASAFPIEMCQAKNPSTYSEMRKKLRTYEQSRFDSLEGLMKKIATIKPGMTRKDLMKMFQEDGGVSSRTSQRFGYYGWPAIKITVGFAPFPETALAEDGEPRNTKDERDVIVSVSEPFLEHPIPYRP